MLPKIPQLRRENATLRQPREKKPLYPVQEAGTNQKIPQTHPTHPKEVWWEDEQKDAPQRDLNEKEGHNDVPDEQHSLESDGKHDLQQ